MGGVTTEVPSLNSLNSQPKAGESGVVLLGRALLAGLIVEARDGLLMIKGPKRAASLAAQLIARKADLLKALADSDAVIDCLEISGEGWRWRVANLDTDAWIRWRRRSTAIVQALGRSATAQEIRDADLKAACELGQQ